MKDNFTAKMSMSKNQMFWSTFRIMWQNASIKDCYKNSSWLWDLQFGHINFKGLELLSKKKMVNDLLCINHQDQFCEGFLSGKQFRKSFAQETRSRVQNLLKLVLTDICWPIKPITFGARNYFLFFIDDFLRKIWVYFLKRKSKAFVILRS